MYDIIENSSGWVLKYKQDFIVVDTQEGTMVDDCVLMFMRLDNECPSRLKRDDSPIPKTILGMRELYCQSCPYRKFKHGRS